METFAIKGFIFIGKMAGRTLGNGRYLWEEMSEMESWEENVCALLEALQYCRNLTLAKRTRQYDLSSDELIEIG